MAVRLSKIKGETRTIRLDFGDAGDLNIVFRPGGITPAREEELQVEDTEGRGVRAVIGLLCEIVESWDLLDDTGEPLPLDVDVVMRTIPGDLIGQIFDGMKVATTPGEASAGT